MMSEEEIEAVARELAKVGGTSWYPGRPRGAVLRRVDERYRDQAQAAILAYRRLHGGAEGRGSESAPLSGATGPASRSALRVGDVVIYRQEGELRAEPCRIERIEAGRAYLTRIAPATPGWVALSEAMPDGSRDDR